MSTHHFDRRALLSGLAAISATPSLAQVAAQPDQMRAFFDAFVKAVEEKFYLKSRLAEIGFRAKADALWPELAGLARPADAAPKLNALLAHLRMSHTVLFTPDDPEFYLVADVFLQATVQHPHTPFPNLGFFTRDYSGRHHVTMILDGEAAAKADLRVGDEIVSIDDVPFTPVASIREKSKTHGTTARLMVRRRPGGPLHDVTLPVLASVPRARLDSAMLASARVIQRGAKRIGILRVHQFRTPHAVAEALMKIDGSLRSYRLADGRQVENNISDAQRFPALDTLIVDNRGPIGGFAPAVHEFLSALRNPPGGTILFERTPIAASVPRATSFAGRCAMLIDHNTRSAGELFAQGFRNENLGPLIGTTTAGAVSAGYAERLPGGLILYVAVSRVTINGVDLEGVGVAPTHRIERPIPYSAGADPVLEAAIAHLASA